MALIPPIEKMDASLSTLVNCEKLSLSTNCIEKIANLNGLSKSQFNLFLRLNLVYRLICLQQNVSFCFLKMSHTKMLSTWQRILFQITTFVFLNYQGIFIQFKFQIKISLVISLYQLAKLPISYIEFSNYWKVSSCFYIRIETGK